MLHRLPLLFLFIALLSCGDKAAPPGPSIAPPAEDLYLRNRVAWQQPAVVLDAMGDLEEKVVADIGAGEGFFAKRLAPLCDRVIAIEIDPVLVRYLNDTLRQLDLPQQVKPRLEARLATVDDPNLRENEVDIVLMVNTFMEIEEQLKYLNALKPALKQGGRIVVVDWKKRLMPKGVGPEQEKRLALYRLEQLFQESGYQVIKSDDSSLEFQYIVVAEKI